MMMTGAFAGMDLLMEAYKQAVEKKYKFFRDFQKVSIEIVLHDRSI